MHQDLQKIRRSYYDFWFGTNDVYESWAKKHGLNNNLLLTLYLLKEYPNTCTQHLICEKLMLPKQTANSILKGLEEKGFITKIVATNDKRVRLLKFTAAGSIYAEELLQKMNDFEMCALNSLSPAQCENFLKNGNAWLSALRKALES